MLDEKKTEDLKKIKEEFEWIFVAQMIERLEKKLEKHPNEEAVSRPSPCCEKPFDKYAKKLNEEQGKEQEEEISRPKEELKPSPAYYSHEQEVERLREENEWLKAQLEAAMAELRQIQRERAAEAVQMIHRNSMWPSPFPRF